MCLRRREPHALGRELPKLFGYGGSSFKFHMTYVALEVRNGELLETMRATRKHGCTTIIHAKNGGRRMDHKVH